MNLTETIKNAVSEIVSQELTELTVRDAINSKIASYDYREKISEMIEYALPDKLEDYIDSVIDDLADEIIDEEIDIYLERNS